MDYITFSPCGHEFLDDGLFGKDCPICVKRPSRKHKYGAIPVRNEHGYFHSTGESVRYNELILIQRAGVITNLERQKAFYLETIKQKFILDFYYKEDGKYVAEDFKGAITDEYRRKKKAFLKEFPDIIFRETKARKAKNKGH